MLANEQRIGAIVLLGIAVAVWLVVAIVRSPEPPQHKAPRRTWEQIKDSMRLADSMRYVQWAAEREQRYDSFRVADSLRRAEWKRIRQQQYDSFRIADSLWRDSVGWRFARHEKRDTVLDLNRCDTAELQLLRGIGRFTAIRIVRYREALGGYYSPAQLTDEALAGLHLDTLLHRFTADPADIQPLSVNSCSVERLQRHPYLRYEQAKALYQLRRSRVRLQSIDDLRSLPEITESDFLRLTPYLRFE
jgi:DNA uptake protein ComE-like DNA-binding protein